ncbi:MAG: hypothetical protein MUF05_07625 [Candidatus Omnitrophica bacterium]|jgi:hypothetical protein|nr:hypothetical protein [Candidatus Omnitrophota bacterium]
MNIHNYLPFIIFPLAWVAIMRFLAYAGGWQELAKYYPYRGEKLAKKKYMQSASLKKGTNYNNCLTIGTSPQGVYLSMWFILPTFHPALFIPWEDITISQVSYWGIKMLELKTKQAPLVPICLAQSLEGFLRQQAGSDFVLSQTSESVSKPADSLQNISVALIIIALIGILFALWLGARSGKI